MESLVKKTKAIGNAGICFYICLLGLEMNLLFVKGSKCFMGTSSFYSQEVSYTEKQLELEWQNFNAYILVTFAKLSLLIVLSIMAYEHNNEKLKLDRCVWWLMEVCLTITFLLTSVAGFSFKWSTWSKAGNKSRLFSLFSFDSELLPYYQNYLELTFVEIVEASFVIYFIVALLMAKKHFKEGEIKPEMKTGKC